MLHTRRSSSRMDLLDVNALVVREQNSTHHLITNYFPSPSPPPMTYRDLRLVMSARPSSNIVILPRSFPFQTSPKVQLEQKTSRKKSKRAAIDVYRTLRRSESPGTYFSNREMTNEEGFLLAHSFAVEHSPTSPMSGFFRSQNLPNLQKQRLQSQRIGSSKTRTSYSSSPSLQIQHIQQGHHQTRSKSSRLTEFSTSVRIHCEPPSQRQQTDDEVSDTTTTTLITSTLPEKQTRRELHVYMPQIYSS